MKKFVFPLERVLGWRRTQARIEEIKLESLHAGRRALEARRKFLREEPSRTLAGLVRAGAVTGRDLEALDRYRKSATAQAARVEASLRDQDREIASQTGAVAGRRRDVHLLEQLRDEKFRKWHREFVKEIDQQAEESHLIRFGGERHGELTPPRL
jgi:hypothetical protein